MEKKSAKKLFNLIFADFCPILASLTPEMMLHTLSASMINQESNSAVITLPLTLKLSLVSTLANRHIEKKKREKVLSWNFVEFLFVDNKTRTNHSI